MVHPDSYRVSRARHYSGTTQQRPQLFAYVAITLYDRLFQASSTKLRFSYSARVRQNPTRSPTTPAQQRPPSITSHRFRLFPFRSPLLGESLLISFPLATEMFHFARLPAYDYEFIVCSEVFNPLWFPHSDIPGSKPARGSPRLFAACYVLRRRLPPRHPPCALFHFKPNFALRSTTAQKSS
jgi:hypothetical protein